MFSVYVFKDAESNNFSYILAASEEMAQLELKQFTHREFKFIKKKPLSQLDKLKAFILWNNIKPFEHE